MAAVEGENEKDILDMVRKQLQRTNPPATEALYARAARIDEGIRELSLRQFNARYPLRIRREMARKEKGWDEADGSGEADVEELASEADRRDVEDVRAAVLQVLFEFAREVVETPAGPRLVELAGDRVDGYMKRIGAVLDGSTGSSSE